MIVKCIDVDVNNSMFVQDAKYFAINQGNTIHVYDELARWRVISSDDLRFCVRCDKLVTGSEYTTIPEYAYFKIEES